MLVGRQVEMHAIGQLLARARLSQGGALLLTGEAGIGKSALLDHVADQAHGFLVLRATGTESEQDLPFAGLAQLLRPLVDHLDALPEPQALALEVALAMRERETIQRFAVGAATLGVLTHAGEDQPVCVVVDDAQLIDRPSQEAIAFAARRLLADKVSAFIAVRTGDSGALSAAGLSELNVTGLASSDGAALAEAVSQVPLSANVLERIEEISAGNPLAIRELARDPSRLAGLPPGSTVPLPATLSDIFERRASELPRMTRAALVLAAVAGGDLPVMARAGPRLGVGLDALVPAEEAGLVVVSVDTVTFTHPLTRAVVYTDAAPERRRAVHAAVADALPEGEQDRRAWHRCAAALGPDESVAAAIEEVGVRSAARGAFAVAATAYDRAARLSPDPAERARRFLVAGESAWFAGEDTRALTLLPHATSVDPTSRIQARAMALRGLIAARTGSLIEARDTLMAAGGAAEHATPEQALVMYAEAVDACLYLLDPSGAKQAAERADRLLRASTGAGSDEVLDDHAETPLPPVRTAGAAVAAIAAGMADVFAGQPGADRIRGGLAYLTETAAAPVGLQPAWEVLGALFLRDSESGGDLIRRAVDERRAAVAVGNLPHLLWHLARNDAATDRWSRAEADYGEAIALAREFGQTTELAASLAGLAWLTARQGRASTCRSLANEATEIATAQQVRLATAWTRFALAEFALSTGDAAAAADGFAGLASWLHELGVLDPDLSPVPELVEALLRTGRDHEARKAAAPYTEQARHKGQPWALARAARVRGMLGTDEDIDAAFAEALALHRQTLDRFEEARTRLVYGERLRRARRRVDARVQLQRALEEFEQLGAQVWAGVALTELQATGMTARRRRTGPVLDLTARELQIALQLADGKTTKETAAALFISPKTVEYHLRHVYTKLGISSRSELAVAVLNRPGQPLIDTGA